MSRAERAKIAEEQKLRAAIRAKAAATGVTAPKSAVDNFVSTYSKTKVGPIQRAVARFFEKIGNTYKASREDKKPVRPRTAPDTSSERGRKGTPKRTGKPRTAPNVASEAGRKGTPKRTKPSKTGTSSTTVSDAQKKNQTSTRKKMARPTPPPARPKKNDKPTKPTSKPKLYTTISVQTGKPVDKKVTAAQHLANLDARKAFLKKRKAAASKIEATLKKGKK